MGKRYPVKAVSHTKKEKEVEEEENYSLQTEPSWEHKAPSGTDSILCARCNVYPRVSPEKGAYQPEESLAKEFKLERSDFVFDRQPDMFCSGRAHQWLSGDLAGDDFSAHNH